MANAVEEFLVTEYVPKLLKNRSILEKSDQSTYSIRACQVLPVTTDGTFMLSTVNRVKVDLQSVDDEKKVQHLDLVIKLSPKEMPPELFEKMIKSLFVNEILVYTKVLPQLTHIGYYPRYYFGEVGDHECSLVLGDFSVNGWRMAPTLVNLSAEHILLAVRYLGRFHGNCYAMKELNNDEFQDIVRQLSKTRFEEVVTGHPVYDKSRQLAPQRGIRAVRNSSVDHIDEEHLQQIEKIFEHTAQMNKDLVQPVEPLAVICHGDFLRNNIAYKYPDANDLQHPEAVSMFDFQTMTYTSPMMDLVTFMCNSTGRDVRGPHFEDIFRAYHQALITVLCEKWEMDSLPEHYSYESFLREYLRLLPFGYSIAANFIPMMHEPMDMAESYEMEDTEETYQELMTRGGEVVDRELRGILMEMYELRKRFGEV